MQSQVQYNSTGCICVWRLDHLTFALQFYDTRGLMKLAESHPAFAFSYLAGCICQRLVAKEHNLLISSVEYKYMNCVQLHIL